MDGCVICQDIARCRISHGFGNGLKSVFVHYAVSTMRVMPLAAASYARILFFAGAFSGKAIGGWSFLSFWL